jgi:hypothetical protein
MTLRKACLLAVGTMLALGLVTVAPGQNASNGNAPLVHVGLNVAACGGTFIGNNSGVVNAHYNAVQKRLAINVSVHDALPNTTYVVDIRCAGAVGALTTNSQGTGTTQIDLFRETAPSTFYVDISVPNGGAGVGGYGDTFIAGPFNLQ